ncbi:MAG TPA: 23S rRNA (adenine(2030)-N(6))-methyltransferase RlmJ [Pusillimonas sp.]|uniref:23S rRNA (adenine(2030)-N(6))-methyltransferase RlmJ n=1 Tax=unclassified Pusillimonas TaxID=2640016 RepID=UPI002620A786|nr:MULTISPECIES: 23S rRNA (adenine(2030)-N(6))-methyltransferase RlmJ [unclassified Pusillimonas]HLU20411.1 23S rRNA (adenine(2030)-N(6))-methyltransferase RlmJ [Pusillimonas sp.]
MFSYRHAFHAGNHADVLKHAVLVQILDHFNQKDNPYWVIDTHAGAGIYDLTSEWAQQNGEFVDGLDRLLGPDDKPRLIKRYLEEVQHFNPDGVANYYPGSPWLALRALREKDRLRLFEMHPSEIEVLKHNLSQQDKKAIRQTIVYEADGFSNLKSLLPPPTRRGIIVIDPSYENKSDYRKVMQMLDDGLKRFATGCYAVWYPLVQRREALDLVRTLERLKVQWTHASLKVRKPAKEGFGLHGSGMFVINPPYTLHEQLESALPWLTKKLAQDDTAAYSLKRSG